MAAARIVMPRTARKGDIVTIKARIVHPMETGFRRDDMGQPIPRNLMTRLACAYGGEEVFAADMFTGVAANPLIVFTTVASESGELTFTWTEQSGAEHVERVMLVVEP